MSFGNADSTSHKEPPDLAFTQSSLTLRDDAWHSLSSVCCCSRIERRLARGPCNISAERHGADHVGSGLTPVAGQKTRALRARRIGQLFLQRREPCINTLPVGPWIHPVSPKTRKLDRVYSIETARQQSLLRL